MGYYRMSFTGDGKCYETVSHGLRLYVRLTPKSARDGLEGSEDRGDGRQVLKVKVRAVPENGKANEALLKVIANALGTGVSQVRLEAGAMARVKTLMVTGDPDVLAARLLTLL